MCSRRHHRHTPNDMALAPQMIKPILPSEHDNWISQNYKAQASKTSKQVRRTLPHVDIWHKRMVFLHSMEYYTP